MQSTGGSLTSRIESTRYDLVKFILVAHSRSTEHVLETTDDVGSLTAAKQKADYRKIRVAGFRASRALIQAMY